jgi:hypothetical protein
MARRLRAGEVQCWRFLRAEKEVSFCHGAYQHQALQMRPRQKHSHRHLPGKTNWTNQVQFPRLPLFRLQAGDRRVWGIERQDHGVAVVFSS